MSRAGLTSRAAPVAQEGACAEGRSMNRNTALTILRFSIVLMILALVMFFVLDVSEPSFVPVCITMAVCYITFGFGMLCLTLDRSSGETGAKKTVAVFLVYTAVCAAAVLCKFALRR